MLIGREREQQAIGTVLASARVGQSSVLVLGGELGIGKTALLADAGARTGEMRVLQAQGVEPERLVPFAGLSQLLRPVLPTLGQVPAAQAAALSTALMLADHDPEVRPTRFAVGAATLSLLSRVAEDRPLAVLVDDAHLFDEASAEALVFAARRFVSDAVSMLVTVRSDHPGAATWSVLPRLEVGGLEVDAAAELLAVGPDPAAHDGLVRLHRATGGNPLALLELAGLGDPGAAAPEGAPLGVPEQLRRAFIGRAGALSPPARVALLVAATDSASAAAVRDACGALGVDATGLVEAADAGLVSLRDDRVEFRHPLVRSAIYTDASPEQRRAVHRALAGVVPAQESDRLAWHLAESAVAPDEATAMTLEQVARQAGARGAHAIAAVAHERAAELAADRGRRAERLLVAAESGWLAGWTGRALSLLDRACAGDPGPRLRARGEELRGAVLTRSGSLTEACRTLVDAAAEAEPTAPDLAVRLWSDAIHTCFYLADPATALRCSRSVDRLLDDHAVDPPTRALALMATGMARVLSGAGEAGIDRVRKSVQSLVDADDGGTDSDLLRHPLRVQGALWLREQGMVRDEVNRAIDRLRERAALGSLPHLLMQIARDGATTDRWADAEAAYVESVRLARETGQSTDLAMSLGGLAMLQARRGEGAACAESAAEAGEIARSNGIRVAELWVAFALGDLAAGAGDLAAAVGHYEALEAVLAGQGFADPDQSCAPELVEALLHLGRVEEAHRWATSFAERARSKGQPWALARAERVAALVGDDESGRGFEAALELHARTPDLYETARTQLAHGAFLRRVRMRVQARPPLRAALETFERLGATPWADRAALELRATGETAHRAGAGPTQHLTPQERQVAQLLAAGRTTREAAAALFLSPKTVESHLRHVYLKLGIRSRAELAVALGRGGPDQPGNVPDDASVART